MSTIKIRSSHGYLTVRFNTGDVIKCEEDEGSEGQLSNIRRIDIKEFVDHYHINSFEQVPTEIDILDVGYILKSNGKYIEPDHSWRRFVHQHIPDTATRNRNAERANYIVLTDNNEWVTSCHDVTHKEMQRELEYIRDHPDYITHEFSGLKLFAFKVNNVSKPELTIDQQP